MDSEASITTVSENPIGIKQSSHDIISMETDENINNVDSSGDANALLEHMDTDNIKNESQLLGNLSGTHVESINRVQAGDASCEAAGNVSSQSEQLNTSHENLATLAAVSAAGGEINANPPQLPIDPLLIANQPAAKELIKPVSNNIINNNILPATVQTTIPPMDEEDIKWHTVGIFQGLSATVTNYIDNSVWSSSGLNLNAEDTLDLSQHGRINLEPGTAYRFRIRALNSVGSSDWSEISSFKTCLPGFPGAPSAIKISKSSEGAHLTWEPPPSCVSSNEIVEYSVYLAVKPGKEKETKAGQRGPAQLAFVRVYVGAVNQCTVPHDSLSAAHVDCSNKPAIIFRIAARNEKGYGPATQVRWLQDPVQNSANNPSLGPNSLLSPTRVKPELTGASPSKRFKAVGGGR